MSRTNNDSPKKRRIKRERKRRRNSIIEVAEQSFVEKGYEDTMMEQIALDAGYTKATIYNYFDSKDDLFAAVIGQTYVIMFDFLDTSLKSFEGMNELRALGNAYLSFVETHPGKSALLDAGRCGLISGNIIEKQKNGVKLTESEVEYSENELKVATLMTEVIAQTMRDSGVEKKVDPLKVIAAISSLNSAIRELIRRGTIVGRPIEETREILWILFNIIEQGVKHYDEK